MFASTSARGHHGRIYPGTERGKNPSLENSPKPHVEGMQSRHPAQKNRTHKKDKANTVAVRVEPPPFFFFSFSPTQHASPICFAADTTAPAVTPPSFSRPIYFLNSSLSLWSTRFFEVTDSAALLYICPFILDLYLPSFAHLFCSFLLYISEQNNTRGFTNLSKLRRHAPPRSLRTLATCSPPPVSTIYNVNSFSSLLQQPVSTRSIIGQLSKA